MEYWTASDDECEAAGQDNNCRTTLEAFWDGNVYDGFQGERTRWDGVRGTFKVKAGWFHAPLIGSPGLYSTKGVSNFMMSAGGSWSIQTEDHLKKPKYNKRWWNLYGISTGQPSGDYEINPFDKTFKIIFDRASDESCTSVGLNSGCRSVITGDLVVNNMSSISEVFVSPKDIGLTNGGYYNEEGGYDVPTWAHGFILAEEENAAAICVGGRIAQKRYVTNMYGDQYNSSWTYINEEWVESNFTDPQLCPPTGCNGEYAIHAIACGVDESITYEELSEEYHSSNHNIGLSIDVDNGTSIKKSWDCTDIYGCGEPVTYSRWNIMYDDNSSNNGSINEGFGIETTSLTGTQQDCENNALISLEDVDYSNCSCVSPNISCPPGFNYDFNLDHCVYECPGLGEWNGMYSPPGCTTTLGDLNGDGIINVLDIVQMINWIFYGAPEYGELFRRGDLNGDGVINIVDVVILVNTVLGNAVQNNLSQIEINQIRSLKKSIKRYPNNLDKAVKDSIDILDRNVIDNWICPKSTKTVTEDCSQMSSQDQILWNEFKSGRK